MNLRPLAFASCCLLALSATACEKALSKLHPREEEAPRTRNVLATEIRLPGGGPFEVARLQHFLERAESTPGVAQVAIVDHLPGIPISRRKNLYGVQREDAPHRAPTASYVLGISSGYFATMEIRLIRGRPFSEGDIESSAPEEDLADRVSPERAAEALAAAAR